MLSPGSQCLLPSAAGGSFSISDWARHLSSENNRISWNHFIEFFVIRVWFYPRSLRPSRQCLAWAPSHGVGLRLDQSLVGHSYNFGATNAQAHLAGRTVVGHRFFRWVSVPLPPQGT